MNVRRFTTASIYHATEMERSASNGAMSEIHALAATEPKGKLEPFTYDPGPLGDEQVEIEVKYCGICHSDLVMLNDELKMTRFPFVPGHEAVGTVAAAGRGVKLVSVGQ